MKTYTNRKPPGWEMKPSAPVIILDASEEAKIRDHLYGFTDLWRKIKYKAEDILAREAFADRVDICDERGEVIRTVRR